MKLWIAAAFVAGSIGVGHAAANDERAARLHFEQVGPSDASIAPFTVKICATVPPNGSTICVSAEKFDQLTSLLRRYSGQPGGQPAPGTLRVEHFENEKLAAVYTILPRSMLPIVVQLIRMLPERPQ